MQKFVPLGKGERSTFFFSKKKKVPKKEPLTLASEETTLQVDGLSSVG